MIAGIVVGAGSEAAAALTRVSAWARDVALDVPVDPDAPEAKRLLLEELSKPGYAEAQPSLFDRISQAIWEWLLSLFTGGGSAPNGLLPAIVVTLVVVAIVVALLIWGVPRLNRRSASVAPGVFSDEDSRDARQIRADAERAAQAGDWALAIAERFRALARSLSERTIVTVTPGTTAHEVAARAATSFPALGDRLAHTARTFDGVRYLGEPGTAERYAEVARLDDDLLGQTPVGFGDTPGDGVSGAGSSGAGPAASGTRVGGGVR